MNPPDNLPAHAPSELSMPDIEVLMAASLSLMTRWAEDCGCHRRLIAHKIAANLTALVCHPEAAPALSGVMVNCLNHWQAIATPPMGMTASAVAPAMPHGDAGEAHPAPDTSAVLH